MTNVWELEKLEKIQEKIVKKKKAHTEKAKEKGDLKGIEKAQAEEDKAIAVLEKIREDKKRVEIEDKILGYVKLNQPTELEEIAKALNLPPESIEKHIEEVGLIKDEEGLIFSDRSRMVAIKSAAWKKKREVATKRWNEIAYINPGLTQQELKEIYTKRYPEDVKVVERFLEEREGEKEEAERIRATKSQESVSDIHLILLIFFIIFVILLVVSCLGTCI